MVIFKHQKYFKDIPTLIYDDLKVEQVVGEVGFEVESVKVTHEHNPYTKGL